MVDSVVATVDKALTNKGFSAKALERWKAEMPTEQEMLPRDKYTMFDKKEKRYRKGVHSQFTLCFSWGTALVRVMGWIEREMGLLQGDFNRC